MAASTNLTPQQRSQRARLAAQTRWANEDPTATAERGQRGLRARFLRQVTEQHPDLPEPEQQRRAESLFKAHMTRLSFASSKARSRKASGADPSTEDGAADAE